MGLLRRHREEVTERHVELVRDAYRSTRAWEMRPVRELLASGVAGREAALVRDPGLSPAAASEADDLVREPVR